MFLCDIVVDRTLDFSEIWHQPSDFLNLNWCSPPRNKYLHRPRATGFGRGLAIIYHAVSPVTENAVPDVILSA